jgi:mannose-6-phosphate isomerase
VRKLEPAFHERIWGTTQLDPWFPPSRSPSGPIGEVWFETPEIPLLVKFLFTSDKLSVQVHPDDEYAGSHHGSPGKTEMWRILAAEPGARIAAGFREPTASEQARAAALSGGIVDLLEWHAAAAGDTFFIPAGTVHSIGAGLTICEIQQRSDITYRFYDFGRGRELHLDSALAVSHLGPYAPRREATVSCQHFVTEPLDVAGAATLPPTTGPALLIVIGGEGRLNGQATRAGDVWHLTVNPEPLEITGNIHLLRTSVPSR